MSNNPHRCVVDAAGYFVEFVLLVAQKDGNLEPYSHEMQPGESLIEAPPPSGMIAPRWNAKKEEWQETGTKPIPTLEDLEHLREQKLSEVGTACTATIYAGVDVGELHYSLTSHDQTELMAQRDLIKDGAAAVPYHADGELCRLYPAAEFTIMSDAAIAHIFYNRTYCNHLNTWIRRSSDYDELAGITYGAELPDDLAAHMAEIIGLAAGGANA